VAGNYATAKPLAGKNGVLSRLCRVRRIQRMIKAKRSRYTAAVGVLALLMTLGCQSQSLWDLANEEKALLKISTLFTAQNVRDHLSTDDGLNSAIDWCKNTGVTKVFIETYRGRYTAKRAALEYAQSRFRAAGFEVSGCVTTTRIGKISTGWKSISCYTDRDTQNQLQEIFEYTASIFDEIMIDDFLFTDCECQQCQNARGDKSWADYRCGLMTEISRERILKPARAVNPNVKIIIKYPLWYDIFHVRGYEVLCETADYDTIWVGTETRDYYSKTGKPGKPQYGAYYLMRWLGRIGGPKTGGGWFDALGTTEDFYVEQARQTVLADAKEMLLFCYGGLLRNANEYNERFGTPIENVKKLREEIPGLFELAKLVRNKPIKGIFAPKPPNSNAYDEQYVFDFVGMLGLPLVPAAQICTDAEAAFFSVHAIKDPSLPVKLERMLAAEKPVLITDGLAERLSNINLDDKNLAILEVKADPHSLLNLTREELGAIRDKLLAPFGIKFDAPNKVALYLIGDDCLVVENFNDKPVNVSIELADFVKVKSSLILPADANVDISCNRKKLKLKIAPRTLIAVEYKSK
jgi:hypothetical protein